MFAALLVYAHPGVDVTGDGPWTITITITDPGLIGDLGFNAEGGEAHTDGSGVLTVSGSSNGGTPGHDHSYGDPCAWVDNEILVGIEPRPDVVDVENRGTTSFLLDSRYTYRACNPTLPGENGVPDPADYEVRVTALLVGKSGSVEDLNLAEDYVVGSGGLVHGTLVDSVSDKVISGNSVMLDPATSVVTITFPQGGTAVAHTGSTNGGSGDAYSYYTYSGQYRVDLPLANDQLSEGREAYTVVIQTVDSIYEGTHPRGGTDLHEGVQDGKISDTITITDDPVDAGVTHNGPLIGVGETAVGTEGGYADIAISLKPRDPSGLTNPDGKYIQLEEDIVLRVNYTDGEAKGGEDYQVRETMVVIPAHGSAAFDKMVAGGVLTVTYEQGHEGDAKTVRFTDAGSGNTFEAEFLNSQQRLITLKNGSGDAFQTSEVHAAPDACFYQGSLSDDAAKALLQHMILDGM